MILIEMRSLADSNERTFRTTFTIHLRVLSELDHTSDNFRDLPPGPVRTYPFGQLSRFTPGARPNLPPLRTTFAIYPRGRPNLPPLRTTFTIYPGAGPNLTSLRTTFTIHLRVLSELDLTSDNFRDLPPGPVRTYLPFGQLLRLPPGPSNQLSLFTPGARPNLTSLRTTFAIYPGPVRT